MCVYLYIHNKYTHIIYLDITSIIYCVYIVGNEPPTALRAPQHKRLPAALCVFTAMCVCVCVCVCVCILHILLGGCINQDDIIDTVHFPG